MKLRQLQALQAIADTGSFQGAAEQLCITQPAISRAIAELELELGGALLTRLARGASLTDFGTRVLQRARAIDREVAGILDAAHAQRGLNSGRLVVAISGVAATHALARALIGFHEMNPEVQLSVIELRRQQIIKGLREREIDIGAFAAYDNIASSAHFAVQRLYELKINLAVSSRSTLPGEVSLAQLGDQTWLTLDALDDPSGLMRRIFAPLGLPLPRRVVRCTSLLLYCELARQPDVVSIWSDPALQAMRARPGRISIRALSLVEGTPSSAMYLAHAEEPQLSSAAREFAAWYRSKLQQTGGSPFMVEI